MQMNNIVLTIMLLFSFNANAVDCDKHKIYCKVIELQPKIDKAFAMELSNIIYKKSKKYDIDPMLSVAILNQESSLRHVNSVHDTKHGMRVDLSIAQINLRTANNLKLDIGRLVDGDVDYALECHFAILKAKIKMCKDQQHSWACYHSKTPEHKEAYRIKVQRFLTSD